MSLPNPSLTLSKSKRKLSLRSLLIVPFVLQIFAAVGLTGYISLRNGQKTVTDLATQLQTEVGEKIEQDVETFLDVPQNVHDVLAASIESGTVVPQNFSTLEKEFWYQLKHQLVPDLFFASPQGNLIGMQLEEGKSTVRVKDQSTGSNRQKYLLDDQRNRTKLVQSRSYNPLARPWYKAAIQANQPTWSAVYPSTNLLFPEMSAVRPIYDKSGKLLGILGSELTLEHISDFLRNLKISASGEAFIMERNGDLIASSTAEAPFIVQEQGKDKTELRVLASNSAHPLTQATAKQLLQRFGSLDQIKQRQNFTFELNGRQQLVHIKPFQDGRGIDWLVVVVIPEEDFMGQIDANTRTTILLCLIALGLATILGIYTSRWITQPIARLNRASEAIAAGRLDQTVEVSGVNELGVLARSFNQMAAQLKTSFIELENRVEERTAELKEAKLVADSANQAKSEFLANMSHELRTPLNGILGYAQILGRSKTLPDKERHGVNIIHQCGSHLLTLINDVLDLSKIEARRLELHPAPLHFPSFLQGVVEINRIRAEQKGITFELHADQQLPMGVSADEKRLRQVLINLLGNAIKFTDRGSVIFKVESIGAKIRFQIQDTGVGMTPQQVEKIFLPFEQVGDIKKQTEGTGLGLAISHKIVSLMQSEIIVQSTLGEGSLFSFAVELPEVEQWAAASRVTQQGMIVGYQGKKQKILVIDDRWENRSVLVNLLEPIGFEMIEASNGQEGIEQTLNTVPDLIITDLAMPVMDGFEFLQKLRSHPKLQDQLVIVSSASVFDLDRHKSIDAGGNDFLPKPVQAETLLELTQKYLQLNWIYDSDRTENQPPIRTPEQIQPPAIDILTQLLELAQIGELDSILDIAQQIQQTHSNLAPFAQELIRLTDACEIVKLRAFIQHYFANTQEQ